MVLTMMNSVVAIIEHLILYNNSSNDIPAVTSGTVITSETHGNFGGTIEIRDANGNDWIYGHLQRQSPNIVKVTKLIKAILSACKVQATTMIIQ